MTHVYTIPEKIIQRKTQLKTVLATKWNDKKDARTSRSVLQREERKPGGRGRGLRGRRDKRQHLRAKGVDQLGPVLLRPAEVQGGHVGAAPVTDSGKLGIVESCLSSRQRSTPLCRVGGKTRRIQANQSNDPLAVAPHRAF
jgi:hypothetical protein